MRPAALLFDVQGTATDFFGTVGEATARIIGDRAGFDRAEFVNRWRSAYSAALREPVPESGWRTVHSIYRAGLDELLGEYGIELTEASREELTASWRELAPWPDTVPGLHRMREHFVLATLSNADVSSVVNITARGDLPWHAVFTAEMGGAFKPDPACYLLAARYLGLAPDRIMMVASHKYDIRAAASLGLRTAFVARPREFGDPALADTEFSDEFDINARDFLDLADQLGA
ncbi:haloacid dehalogenase type II [Nocardia panacis]|uniref:Haloacid dehalogenase type II n=1 Tax=Nocardia panacis TaxID=2340916 RepID=A0A3A4KTG9_9NOCA|nr:haloacid dehalogenase type II [Nocardia panacis]RJO79445.1 haloacid dehalogenase type II [Nocardia panacis]